jgi:hypothetical protein
MGPTKRELVDLWWRAVWTFVALFGASLAAAGLNWVELSAIQMAGLSGLGGVITVVTVYARQKAGTIEGAGRER